MKLNQKLKVTEDITTVDGTLYKGETVMFQEKEKNGDIRVKDMMGRIWFIDRRKLK